jgi:hypothetical protein
LKVQQSQAFAEHRRSLSTDFPSRIGMSIGELANLLFPKSFRGERSRKTRYSEGGRGKYKHAPARSALGHATADMTALYTGEIPVEQVTKHFQLEPNGTVESA